MNNNINRYKNFKPLIFMGFAITAIIFLLFLYFLLRRGTEEVFNYNFDGRVSNITYDIKDDPTVTINRQQFLLPQMYWATNHEIAVGDSLRKQAGSMKIVLVKYSSHEMLFFRSK